MVERIAIACRLQLFVSLCGGIIKVEENTKIPRLPHAQTPEEALTAAQNARKVAGVIRPQSVH